MKTRYDSRATDHHFKEGDLDVYNSKRRRGLSTKLQHNWGGFYTVIEKLNDVVYRVQRSPNAKPKVIHINGLAPYRATDHSYICRKAKIRYLVPSLLPTPESIFDRWGSERRERR
ncbi:hypothetical protein AVEN_77122-1 [Araneus ventricosus]|uniref:Integrase p58-like C-terminal domain-containing protein n=1 Tax=Araneus ventricosus TaxID=182803 RepID=A0A4Y2INZ8_ARAVE|nr:hypothetical protein AVEN_77122-1 [Araneus ventricosus]